MANLRDIGNIWNNVKEFDLQPLHREALAGVQIALVGPPEPECSVLASQLRRDPSHPNMVTHTPVQIYDTLDQMGAQSADLTIVILNEETLNSFELDSHSIIPANKKIITILNQQPHAESSNLAIQPDGYAGTLIVGSIDDGDFLLKELTPRVLEMLPNKLLALGRDFPLFRVPIAHHLINETCLTNAIYSLSTGVAEIVPVLGLPLNLADMVILSKNQAFLVYKLGLTLGLSTKWQDYIAEFGGVLGGGFLWRQIARSLVGFIPAYGILPKVAISYSGTYVVGQVVLRWYLTGRHVSKQQMKELYGEAISRGKNIASQLTKNRPRLRKSARRTKKQAELPGPTDPS